MNILGLARQHVLQPCGMDRNRFGKPAVASHGISTPSKAGIPHHLLLGGTYLLENMAVPSWPDISIFL